LAPDLKVRLVNVVDIMKLLPHEERPHGLTNQEFDEIFTKDRPVTFAYTGPWLIHRLTYRPTNHGGVHVRGYKEEGTTTTPFDMLVKNEMGRFNLTADAAARIAKNERGGWLRPPGDARQAGGT
jgi:xylulose-5-phosphate/fructose-6-phosphate phosphoketolase